ncbi:MAG: hypothetical protein ACRDYZ_04595 [Acidimicrobiales bacterium]
MCDVELLYRQHLTEGDRRLLRAVGAADGPMAEVLGSPALEQAVFGPDEDRLVSLGCSPFLTFAVAVHRTADALESATFVEERWAPRLRIPVFDADVLRNLLAGPERRFFLVELLASYTRVHSGVTWTRTARGWSRRRYSELDPSRLAELLDVVEPTERPGIYRRLGDLALFLLGVFPDHRPPLGAGATTERLLRLSGVAGERVADLDPHVLLELLGARWYGAALVAARTAGQPVLGMLTVAGYMGDHFHDARRVLNAVTDRHLYPWRDRWFGGG